MTKPRPNRDTDRDWETIAKSDPYFGSLTNPAFKGKTLSPEIQAAFLESGRSDIAHTLALFRRNFQPPERFFHGLDFGCGAGRWLTAMVPHTDALTGVDVSKSMRKVAKAQVKSATITPTLPEGRFDWINSFAVFQHIMPERGLELLDDLLAVAAPDACLSVHFAIDVLPRPDQGNVGRISLYAYDFPTILGRMAKAGFSRVVTEYLDHGMDKGVRLISARGRFAA